MNRLELKYQLTGPDVVECLKVHQPSFRLRLVVGVLASFSLIAIGALWLVLPGSWPAFAWASIGFGVATLVVQSVTLLNSWRFLRKNVPQLSEVSLAVDDQGLVVVERGARSEVGWSRYVRLGEGTNHFLLYRSKDLYVIVPKRGFTSASGVDEFRRMAIHGIANA